MADRFVEAATQQIAPVYDQQINQLQGQIPAIQQLYQTLIAGLKTENQATLDTGVQQISEDASARGVLRSSLPVDTRTTLTGQLGAALNKGLSEINLRQIGDISGIQERVGSLGISKAKDIVGIADSLRSADMKEREFAMQQSIMRQEAAAKASEGGVSPQDMLKADLSAITQGFQGRTGSDGYVSPTTYNQARSLWVNTRGGNGLDFDKYFAGYRNPKNPHYTYGKG